MHLSFPKMKTRRVVVEEEYLYTYTRYDVLRKPFVKIIWTDMQRTLIFGHLRIDFKWKKT
ncbi:hypothetical protein COU13_01415 [Candidatus Kaiserbacteria bacterium CG10_big_fil_rev_8_21_14_0_10_43_70]|uniref:Uncharacterized protein n=1 Tax=Candidatus Kaiserbacteria bacterium CG10_big_fil_rev_8_21_14_0_10_43_70 TaxID=1974605 RepID=A0A2H0UKP9_9BACT|nr:MAG: hypothetical protein COU13_01415 [Candidatus Kaiserbacteria bacterium CG10_big_fil_rev_8_21_14_0_10_43_70]